MGVGWAVCLPALSLPFPPSVSYLHPHHVRLRVLGQHGRHVIVRKRGELLDAGEGDVAHAPRTARGRERVIELPADEEQPPHLVWRHHERVPRRRVRRPVPRVVRGGAVVDDPRKPRPRPQIPQSARRRRVHVQPFRCRHDERFHGRPVELAAQRVEELGGRRRRDDKQVGARLGVAPQVAAHEGRPPGAVQGLVWGEAGLVPERLGGARRVGRAERGEQPPRVLPAHAARGPRDRVEGRPRFRRLAGGVAGQRVAVVVGELQKPFQARGRMVRPRAVKPVRKQQHQPRLLAPPLFSGRDKDVDGGLGVVGEIAKLRLPDGESAPRGAQRVTVLKR